MNSTYSRVRKIFSVSYLFLATNRLGNQNGWGDSSGVFMFCFILLCSWQILGRPHWPWGDAIAQNDLVLLIFLPLPQKAVITGSVPKHLNRQYWRLNPGSCSFQVNTQTELFLWLPHLKKKTHLLILRRGEKTEINLCLCLEWKEVEQSARFCVNEWIKIEFRAKISALIISLWITSLSNKIELTELKQISLVLLA